jgi:hypothetical protein
MSSRYSSVEQRTIVRADGTMVAYLARRFIPPSGGTLAQVPFEAGDRLDLIAQRTLGDSTSDWRLADASVVLWPDELEREARVITVAMPNLGL